MEVRSILIICVGNICRSPMAEAVFKHTLKENGKGDVAVRSAGIGALVGAEADSNAQRTVNKVGLDISSHRAVQVQKEMVDQADLILVMEGAHKIEIGKMYPLAYGKVFRIGEWKNIDIHDPYLGPLKSFEEAMEKINLAMNDWLRIM